MANVLVNNIAVPRVPRNKRIYSGTTGGTTAVSTISGTVIDWAVVTDELVTINRNLHVEGDITASQEVVAWVAGAVSSDVLANLTATAPLRKSTTSNLVLDYNTSQFEVIAGALKIRDDFAGGGSVTSVALSAPVGFSVSGSPVTSAGTLALAFAAGYSLPTTVKQGQWDAAYTYSQVGHIPLSQKGSANGVAELDGSGKVLSAQLPSYVDDVLEYSNLAAFPATGESGKIYIAQDTNLSYRWTGSGYAEISPSIALGETSSTAYRGDRGKIAYDHSQVITGNPHQISIADLTDGSNVAKLDAVGNTFLGNQTIIKTFPIFALTDNSVAQTGVANIYTNDTKEWRVNLKYQGSGGDDLIIRDHTRSTNVLTLRGTDGLATFAAGISATAGTFSGIVNALSYQQNGTALNSGHLSDGSNLAKLDAQFPASSTDNAIARFNGTTGKVIQNSSFLIDDSGTILNKIAANQALSLTQIADLRNTHIDGYGMFLRGGSATKYALFVQDYAGNAAMQLSGDGNLTLYNSGILSATAGTFTGAISTRSKYELRDGTGTLKWSFELSGDDLVVKNSAGTIRGKINQAGDFAVEGEVTAYAAL